jgi:WD40 repeat protein
LNKIIGTLRHAKEWVEEIRYSPDGEKLAVGSHDNFIYLYNVVESGAYTKYARCKGHSSYITCVDWTLDSSIIRTVCGAYELLFFNA